MPKFKKISKLIDFGLYLASTRVNKEAEKEHELISKQNKAKFEKAWEEQYGKDTKGREPLKFDDKGENNA